MRATVATRSRTWGCWRTCVYGGPALLPASPTLGSCSGTAPCFWEPRVPSVCPPPAGLQGGS